MDNTSWLDGLLGGLSILILLGGLWMLFGGIKEIGKR